MLQPKDTDWLNGCKDKTRICAVYKKPTSDQKTHIKRNINRKTYKKKTTGQYH